MNSSRPAPTSRGGASADAAFEAELERHRRGLLLVGYQMLGSGHDAEDVVQETMLRAWRARDRFDPGRASMRTWLHHIATNVALTALSGRRRRPLPSTLVDAAEDPTMPLVPDREVPWLLPLATARLDGDQDDPATIAVRRGAVSLAFTAAVQLLPPRQRAALVLCEVLAFGAAEAADALGTSPAAVNSLLQRARRALPAGPAPSVGGEPGPGDEALVERYTDAFVRGDVAALRALLAADAVLEMPPVALWYRGADRYAAFMERVYALRGVDWRTVRTSANGQPAFAAYARADDGAHRLHSLQVLTLAAGRVARNVVYVDPAAFAELDLPPVR